MPLLLSFVNQVFTPELRLGYCDEKDGDFRWITPELPWETAGATGITTDGADLIYVCYQKAGLVVYDLSLQVKQIFDFTKIKDPHTILFRKGALYVVSTITNEIYKIKLNKKGLATSEEIYWQMPGMENYAQDFVHMNSIDISSKGDFYITHFGMEDPEGWDKTRKGGVMNISSDDTIASNLHNPHSAYCLGDRILFCESTTGKLFDQNGLVCEIDGYVRGITENKDSLIVASSARRKISKSRGILKGRFGAFEEDQAKKSFIHILNKKDFKIIESIETTSYGKEIFELLWFPPKKLKPGTKSQDPNRLRIESFEQNLLGLVDKIENLTNQNPDLIFHEEGKELLAKQELLIENRDNQVKELQEILTSKDDVIAARDKMFTKVFTKMQKELDTKEKAINAREKINTDAMLKKEQALEERAAISLKQLARKDEVIGLRDEQLKKNYHQMTEFNLQMSEKEKRLGEVEHLLRNNYNHIDELKLSITEKTGQNAILDNELKRKNQEHLEGYKELTEIAANVDIQEQDLTSLKSRVERLRGRIASRDDILAGKNKQIAQQNTDIDLKDTELSLKDEKIGALKNSLSWKISAPLRWISKPVMKK